MRTLPTNRRVLPVWMLLIATVVLHLGCADHGSLPPEPRFGVAADVMGREGSAWSEPVNLGPIINSPAVENGPELSPDELSLYFNSDRSGNHDIYVSRRACLDCPWETPVELGPNINTPETDGTPALSGDGHLLFFTSNGHGGHGGEDLWLSRRTNTKDDFGWGPPVNLGPGANTSLNETSAAFLPGRGINGRHTLYFVRWATTTADFDIYQVSVSRNGEAVGPATPVTELNLPGVLDSDPTIRADGRELMFWSGVTGGGRPGAEGGGDIWVATRCSVRDPWSAPRSIGPPVNTAHGGEFVPALSHDGRTLMFVGNMLRGGSFGRQDLWMSTRTRPFHDHDDGECNDDDRPEGIARRSPSMP